MGIGKLPLVRNLESLLAWASVKTQAAASAKLRFYIANPALYSPLFAVRQILDSLLIDLQFAHLHFPFLSCFSG